MTTDQAFEFFFNYGNTGRSSEDLKGTRPTYTQLSNAQDHAIRINGRKSEESYEAMYLVRRYFDQVDQGYLFVVDKDSDWVIEQSMKVPTEEQIGMCIDGLMHVIRFNSETRKYERMSPIDRQDLDNWEEI